MAKSLQLRYAAWYILIVQWAGWSTAYAAENPLVTGIEAIPIKAFIYVLALSIIGGTAGTLAKLSRNDIVVRNLPLEIAKDIVASLVAGLLVFFFSSWWESINFWLQAALVTMAGYGGSRVLDVALVDGFFPWMQRVFGRVHTTEPPRPAREETPQ